MRIRGVDVPDEVLEPPPSAWPAPADAPVLLFGGTFDPPHWGHVQLPARARDALLGDAGWLIYVPAARNPLKTRGPAAGDTDRVEMLRLASAGVPRCAVWTDEIDRAAGSDEPSYWVDTLARAASLTGDTTPLRFLIGADQALSFGRWRAHETIRSLAEPAVLLRDPAPDRETFRRLLQQSGQDPAVWMGWVVDVGVRPAASTSIRDALASGADPAALGLPGPVADYIVARGLYRSPDRSPFRGPDRG